MNAEEILSKIIQEEIDMKVLSELFDAACVPKEESDPHIQKLLDRQEDFRIRMVWDMTNESIHKIN